MLPPIQRGRIVLALVAGVWLASPEGRAGERAPSATLLVIPADPAAEAGAARFYTAARKSLRETRSLRFVDADHVLAGDLKDETYTKRVQELYKQGREAYDNLDLNGAVKLLKRAAREIDAHLDEKVDVGFYTDVHIYWGSALVLNGKKKQGEKVYRRLLIFNRQAELDPMVFPPTLSATFNRIAGEVRRAGVGALNIQAPVEGTEVWVDEIFRGISPVIVDGLAQGEHIVRLVRRGYRSWGRKLELLEGSREVIRRRLQPLPGFERLEGLTAQMAAAVRTVRYPRVADELMDWIGVERIFFMLVGTAEAGFTVRAFYYDRPSQRRLKAQKKVFDPGDPSFDEVVSLFCASLYMDVGGQAIAETRQPIAGGAEIPFRREEEREEDSSGSSWWLWTAIAVVVAGGVGLALYFTLGWEEGPGEGEVFFRF